MRLREGFVYLSYFARLKILVVVSADRKYLQSGRSSKISDNEHSFPDSGGLRNSAVKHLPLEVIPQLIKRIDDCSESSPFVVRE